MTSRDNLLPNQSWLMCSLPVRCIVRCFSKIKTQRGGEGTAKVFTQEGKKEKSLARWSWCPLFYTVSKLKLALEPTQPSLLCPPHPVSILTT